MKLIKRGWSAWLKIAKIIGNFQAQILFTIFYFIVLSIIGIVMSFFSDPLDIKSRSKKTNFSSWEHPEEGLSQAQKPY